jgi:hypothetical protein
LTPHNHIAAPFKYEESISFPPEIFLSADEMPASDRYFVEKIFLYYPVSYATSTHIKPSGCGKIPYLFCFS